MRFECVTARAFGPHRNQTLHLGRNLTIVYGPNEAGKSSWHAALFAALCGMRRAKGMPRKPDAEFARRHRPWEGKEWQVGAVIELDSGRRIELRQELDGKVDCEARDVAIGRDLSAEIMNDGCPDGARCLGLDRRSFIATACVRQAEIQSVLDEPEKLQEHLQRAAATAGKDATAAAAIETLEGFKKEHVGKDMANSTKPLRKAVVRHARAENQLREATERHQEYARLVQRARGLADQAGREEALLRAARAAKAAREAEEWSRRLARARQLHALQPTAPTPLPEDQALAEEVAGALAAWRARPDVPVLDAPDAAELRERLAVLPEPPAGDTTPDPRVEAAAGSYARARQAVALHDRERPQPPEGERAQPPEGERQQPPHGSAATSAPELSPQDLRDLARALAIQVPEVDPELRRQHDLAQARLIGLDGRRRHGTRLLLSAAGGITAGAVLLALDQRIPGAGLLALSALLAFVALYLRVRAGSRERVRILEELRRLEAELGARGHAAAEAARVLEAARRRASALALSHDPEKLRRLAAAAEEAAIVRTAFERWSGRHRDLEADLRVARAELVAALRARGVEIDAGREPDPALESYVAACLERSKLAARARRRSDLEGQLADREAAERAAAEGRARRTAAARALCRAAASCRVARPDGELDLRRGGSDGASLTDEELDRVADSLKAWQSARTAALALHDRAADEWAELQALLGGGTLDDLRRAAEANAERARDLLRFVEPGAEIELADDVEAQLQRLERERNEAAERAAEAHGRVEEAARQLPSVAEAEEELEAAAEELARVRRLEGTLATTICFLESAQERVHRTIAPILADTVRRWLPEVTSGRYVDVTLDPATLEVQVCGPDRRWREAALLSHGTAEQIYLLLRMALAAHLATTGESCPLVLDEVTVQCDRERTAAMLRTLKAVSRERQVILFTQEEDVLEWAEDNLKEEEGDRLERLGAAEAIV